MVQISNSRNQNRMNKRPNRTLKFRHALTIITLSITPLVLSPVSCYANESSAAWTDWKSAEELSDSELKTVRPGCSGIYVDPTINHFNATSKDETLLVEANNAEVSHGNNANLSGSVTVRQGNKSLTAQQMQYDRLADKAQLSGDVTIRQPGILIKGNNAKVEFKNNRSRFEGASFVMHETHLRGSASAIGQVSDNIIQLENGKITSCEPDNNGWSLEGETLSINSETRQGKGKNVKLKIASVPVLYLPYISFPVGEERQSGFLFPALSSSEDGGFDIALPYYWNIAPNYDATITPRLITSRGPMLETEFRHLIPWVKSELRGAFLPNDSGSNDQDLQDLIDSGEITEEQANPNKGNNRWLINFEQDGGSTRGWYIHNDFSKVSDIDYFRDLGSSSFAVSNNSQLDQIFSLGFRGDNWNFGALLEDHQLLLGGVSNTYKKEPQLDIDGFYQWRSFSTTLQNSISKFVSTSAFDAIEGNRVSLDYRANWNKKSPWGFFKPEVGYKYLNYDLSASRSNNDLDGRSNQNYDAFQTSIDTGLRFERSFSGFTHTFEPRAFYLYREFVDQSDLFNLLGSQDLNFDTFFRTFSYDQLFRDSRFIGSDRIDDANQLTLGASSRFINNKNGQETFRVSLGKIYYRQDRRVFLDELDPLENLNVSSSEVALETSAFLNQNAEFILNAIYDTKNERTNRSTARFHYATKNKTNLFNFAYTRTNGDIPGATGIETLEQTDVSTAIQISPQWAMMARSNYDFQNSQELETFIGFEYDDCCYRVRFLARKWLDSNIASLTDSESAKSDSGLFMEFHLKGLGGSGAKINAILNDGIYGYDQRKQKR